MKQEWTLHVGIPPYRDAEGVTRACYQAVIDGRAWASVSLRNGAPERLASVEARVCMGSLVAQAQAHFRAAVPSPDYFHGK